MCKFRIPLNLHKVFAVLLLSLLIIISYRDGVYSYNPNHIGDRLIDTKCTVLLGRLNHTYKNLVSQEQSIAYVFHVERKYIQRSHTTKLRVEVGTTPGSSLRYPVLFVVRQQRHISSLEVPYCFEDSSDPSPFFTAGRTLCIEDADDDDRQGRNVTIRVSTQSGIPVKFYLMLRLTEDFQLPLNKEVTFEVSPTAPKYFGFTFSRPDLNLVKIRASSLTTNCMTVSVQRIQCPIHDTEDNVRHQGLWQTMSTTAAMTVQKTLGWFKKGFILVFVTHIDDNACDMRDFFSSFERSNRSNIIPSSGSNWDYWDDVPVAMTAANRMDPRSKTVTIKITDERKVEAWIIWLCLMLPIAATFLLSFVVLLLFRNRHEWLAKVLTEQSEQEHLTIIPLIQNGARRDDSIPPPSSTEDDETAPASPALPVRAPRIRPMTSYSTPKKSPSHCKRKADLYIANFNCKQYHEVQKFTRRFYWTIAIVAIFYSIPVYQLVFHYLRVLYRTGEYDICYYNYLCAHRLGILIDSNHFWSNASYVIFGILFIVIVRQRSSNLCLEPSFQEQRKRQGAHHKHQHHHPDDESETGGFSCCRCCFRGGSGRNRNISDDGSSSPGKVGQARLSSSSCFCTFSKTCFRWDHGVPPHFGVFYALGVALTMEGFLSAAYHLCPNQSTFQFDTCFMYVIAVLLLLKIYQFRHPVHFGANHTFAILAGFVTISVVGLLFERGTEKDVLIFKCIYYPIQYILMIFLFVYYYAVGYVKDENNELITDWRIFGKLGQLKSQKINGDRLILPLISLSICVAVLVYSEIGDQGFATYLLYLLVGNVLGATFYYVGIMKPLHGEFKNRTWVQPVIYFLASGVIGGFSVQYFVRSPAQWELSASASRAMNEECLQAWFPFPPFYDSHDAWHFLSAAALFLAFMEPCKTTHLISDL